MADYEINLGKTLKELRNHQGITQKELGKQLDLTSQAYSRYETGDRLPDLKMACRIARYYHITLDQLVCRACIPILPGSTRLPRSRKDTGSLLKIITGCRPEVRNGFWNIWSF